MTIEIPLTQGQVALIDDEDYELVSQYKRCVTKYGNNFYAVTNIYSCGYKRTTIRIHRLVMNAKPGELVDHINHHTLDNRKSELRLCTHFQNHHNSGKYANNKSGFKGVSWCKRKSKWRASIMANGKHLHLGYFIDPEEAYKAYCEAALELHREFARLA
ncbi:MAG: AP2 domain-containing protein [Acidithiobacillus ferriphilus]